MRPNARHVELVHDSGGALAMLDPLRLQILEGLRSPDSASGVARKLGLPTVSIWGPTNPASYLKIPAAQENRHLFHYNKVACSPCVHHHEQLPCGGNNFCMKDMAASSIIEKLNRLLEHLQIEKDRVAALESVTG